MGCGPPEGRAAPSTDPPTGSAVVGLAAMGADPADFLPPLDDAGYRFVVAGHTYGRHDEPADGLFEPLVEAWSVPGALDGVRFAVLCGDVVPYPHPDRFAALDRDLERLALPVFLAPGNHDTLKPDRPDVVSLLYGRRRTAFRYGPDAFVVADTATTGGNLAGEDLEAVRRMLASKPRVLFVFLHHLIWVDEAKVASGEVEPGAVNGLVGYAERGTFDEAVLPLLREAGTKTLLFAGDLGAGSAAVQTYEERAENVVLLAGGMGEHGKVGVYHSVVVREEGVEIEVRWLGSTGERARHFLPLSP